MPAIRISRRAFAQSLGAVPLFSTVVTGAEAQTSELIEMLAAVADLVVPRDDTPSASDIGVHERLIEQARKVPNYPRLLSEGLNWMEQQARTAYGRPFLALTGDRRDRIFAEAFDAAPGTLPAVFARRVRTDVLTAYYRDARVWAGLGIDRPIQPEGYPDFEHPPA